MGFRLHSTAYPSNEGQESPQHGGTPMLRQIKTQESNDFHELDFKCQVLTGQRVVGIERYLIV